MRTSMAYFAGVGTVIVAVTAGLGGGYLAANITNPPTQAISKLERRMSADPINVSTAPAEPVQDVASTAATNSAAAPAQEQAQQQQPQTQQQPNTQQQPQPQIEAAAPSRNPAPVEGKPAPGDRVNVVLATAEEDGTMAEGHAYPPVLGEGQAIPGIVPLRRCLRAAWLGTIRAPESSISPWAWS